MGGCSSTSAGAAAKSPSPQYDDAAATQQKAVGGKKRRMIKIPEGDIVPVIPWCEEPHHRQKFENEYIRVYEVSVPPGSQTLLHKHDRPTFFAMLGVNGAVQGEVLNAAGEFDTGTMTPPYGSCFCSLVTDKDPLIHRIKALDTNTSPLFFVGAEALKRPRLRTETPMQSNGYIMEDEQVRFRTYRLTLEPGEETGKHPWPFCAFTVIVQRSKLEVKGDKDSGFHKCKEENDVAGQCFWQPGPSTHSVKNVGSSRFEALVVEWV